MAAAFLDTVVLIFVLFGAFSISILWTDFFYSVGNDIGWYKHTLLGSFYLAAVLTIFFIIVVLLLQYFRINLSGVLGTQLGNLSGGMTTH